MPPDFPKPTVDMLAKRAAYLCSNPDCRTSTVGPNSEEAMATIIGEAAHIYAARPDQARYNLHMTDEARSAISNGVWLCRNCHKQIDRDPAKFPADLLFLWREQHEKYVASNLGSPSDKARFELAWLALAPLDGYPPLIRRIAFDKPTGWEWSLTGELMRHLNAPLFRKLIDLRDGVAAISVKFLNDGEAVTWVQERISEMGEMVEPIKIILTRFDKAWGKPGEPGDIDEIHHTTLLLRDSLARIVRHEEELYSVRSDSKFDEVIGLLKNALGSQAEKFKRIPDRLDEFVQLAIRLSESGPSSEPTVVQEIIEFDLPDGWSDNFGRAMDRLQRKLSKGQFVEGLKDSGNGNYSGISCLAAAIVIGFFILIL